ncbi:MAG: carbamate kinase [Bacillota bacterium]
MRMTRKGELLVVALGGNAIQKPGERGTAEEQLENIAGACRHLAALMAKGYRLVLTHGNGPQVGSILLQNEAARDQVPAMPLDICGAQTQGLIGYMFQQSLSAALSELDMDIPVTTVVTQTLVSAEDPDFLDPSKPIGPFYSENEADSLAREKGFHLKEDSGRGWRRVVPSPDPREIIERKAIGDLVDSGAVVIASGGGGIPVIRDEDGNLRGIEAVIDKDLAGERLARDVDADGLMILTDVDNVAVDFGTPEERQIFEMTIEEAENYLEAGHFRAGSMKPKVTAAMRFVRSRPGRWAKIAGLDKAERAVEGNAGTMLMPMGE